jgi:hypothetical protein
MVPFGVDEDAGREARHRRNLLLIPAALCLLALLAIGFKAVDSIGGDSASGEPTSTEVEHRTTTTTAPPADAPVDTGLGITVPRSTDLATPHGKVAAYDKPNGNLIGTAGEWYGYSMTLPVLQQGFGWVQVRMPERPNGSTAWLRAADVDMSSTPYHIVVRRDQTHAYVFKGGEPLFDVPIGMGKASTPTPLGSFFVAVVEHDVGHGYGPIVLDLSAHSEAIQSWQGAGDAIIAFHGPFGAQSRIAAGKAYVSNGCMRMLPADQLKMAEIPVGTPVDIIEI